MPTLQDLTEKSLRSLFSADSLRIAQSYTGLIRNPVRADQTLRAQVEGAQLYNVEIDAQPSRIVARCTCLNIQRGPCAHVGALLLAWAQRPETFAQDTPPVPDDYPIEVVAVRPPPTRQPPKLPSWVTTSIADRQQVDDQSLAEWLEGTVLRELRQIASQHGWKLKGTKKTDVIQQIVAHLADPATVLKAVFDLDQEQRQVLHALLLLGNEPGPPLKNLAQIAGLWGRLAHPNQVETYTRHLCDLGLVVAKDKTGDFPFRNDVVPFTIARQLPPVLQGVVPQGAPAGEIKLGDPYALARTANQITLLLEQSPTDLSPPMPRPRMESLYPSLSEWDYNPDELARAKKDGQLGPYSDLVLSVPPPGYSLPAPTIKRLLPVAGDEARLEFIFSLLVAAGVFQPGSPITVWPEVKMRFLQRDELAQRALLARVYFYTQNWNELWEMLRYPPGNTADWLVLKRLWNVHYLKPQNLYDDLLRFRQLVLRVLASLPDGQWVTLRELFRPLRLLWPRFDQTVWQSYWRPSPSGGWFLSKIGSKKPLDPENEGHWHIAQGNFVRTVISGPLHWLGLADLSFEDGALQAVRFHGLADLYWDRVESPPAPPHAAAQAQAGPPQDAVQVTHHTIHVRPSHVKSQAHGLLDKIARLDTVDAERFVYHLDARAAYEAFEAGTTLPEILADWEEWMPISVPETIRAQLSDWWEAYGRVRIYENLAVIEFGDDYALAEIKASTSLEKHLIAEISPRLVVVSQQATASLMAELEKAGYTPKQTEEI
jgi:hypothetical protein